MNSKVIDLLEEQTSFGFTGKLNFLIKSNRQYYGHILLKNGELVKAVVGKFSGFKALYHLFFEELTYKKFDLILEPELVDDEQKDLFPQFEEIKKRLEENLKIHQETIKLIPPANIKIYIDPEFIQDTLPVTPEEFEVLKVLAQWNSPREVYENCSLLEHEVTFALVGLRKKDALKIIAAK